MSAETLKITGLASLAVALLAAGSAYLVDDQWRNDVATARRAADTTSAQMLPLLEDALRAARYADLPALVSTWGRADASLTLIRVETQNGFRLADYARPASPAGQIERTAAFAYGYQGTARLTLAADLAWAAALRRRFALQLGLANLALDAAIAAIAWLMLVNRRSVRRYRTISATNQALLSGTNDVDVLEKICTAAVGEGGFALAWIGLAGEHPVLRPAAVAGPALGYAQGLTLSVDANDDAGKGPAGIALREGRPYVCNDFQNDPVTAPWAERARRFGIRASAALPLRQDGRLIGILGLYSAERGHFDAVERALVEQMAGDISLGLEHHRRGLELERSLAQLRQIETTVRAGAFQLTLPGRAVWWSAGALALLGTDPAHPASLAGPAEELLELAAAAAAAGGEFDIDFPLLSGAAPLRWLRVTGVVQQGAGGDTNVSGLLQDISERRALEGEVASAADAERRRLASELHDNLSQLLTAAALQLAAVEKALPKDAVGSKADVAQARALIIDSMQACRTLAHSQLPTLAQGLGPAIESLARDTAATGVACSAVVAPQALALSGAQAVELYRIAQEAVTNSLKHARCKAIRLALTVRGSVTELSIEDDGMGFGRNAGQADGLGLRTMRYRAARAGGTITFRNGTAGGAAVVVTVSRLVASPSPGA